MAKLLFFAAEYDGDDEGARKLLESIRERLAGKRPEVLIGDGGRYPLEGGGFVAICKYDIRYEPYAYGDGGGSLWSAYGQRNPGYHPVGKDIVGPRIPDEIADEDVPAYLEEVRRVSR